MIANFLFFWGLVTFAISRGDILGIALGAFGFVFMHSMIEEMYGTA